MGVLGRQCMKADVKYESAVPEESMTAAEIAPDCSGALNLFGAGIRDGRSHTTACMHVEQHACHAK